MNKIMISKREVVPPQINSVNATPNPVVEGGTIIFTKAVLFIMIMASICIPAIAVDVHIYDKTGFEIDAFNAGDTAIISAEADGDAFITIAGPDTVIENEPMTEKENGTYEYEFVPKEKGTYVIDVKAGSDIVSTQLFAATDLDLDWEELTEQNDNHSEQVAKTIADRAVFQKIIDYIKDVLSIING